MLRQAADELSRRARRKETSGDPRTRVSARGTSALPAPARPPGRGLPTSAEEPDGGELHAFVARALPRPAVLPTRAEDDA